MTTLTRAQRRRHLSVALLRALVVAVLLLGVYYLAPLDRLDGVPLWLSVTVGMTGLAAVSAYQIGRVMRARYPALRAIGALAATIPLFLLTFAAGYFLMAADDAANFSAAPLTRTDTLYFTVTVFSTVGFGDIAPVSQSARVMVMAQMLLNLVVLGAGIRLLTGAVEAGRQHQQSLDDG